MQEYQNVTEIASSENQASLGVHDSTGAFRFLPLPPARPAGREPVGLVGGEALGNTYEITSPPPDESFSQARLQKYALQSAARSILTKDRVCQCLRYKVPEAKAIGIWKTAHEAFHYGGLMICGSVWVCPVCSSKITEKRRAELVDAFVQWQEQGGRVLLLTLTVPHQKNDSLASIFARFAKAREIMHRKQGWIKLKARTGIHGSVRGLEVTYGVNGWHVHTHELLFLKGDEDPRADELLKLWKSSCKSAGLSEPNEHGVSIDDGNKASQYVTKWGLEHEMTKSHTKKGKLGGLTPFDFLRDYLTTGDEDSAKLFKEFAKTFKGKRQLTWSRGLRELLDLGKDSTDEDLANSIEEDSVKFASIPLDVWRVVVAADQRGQVLEVCRQGKNALMIFLITLFNADMKKRYDSFKERNMKEVNAFFDNLIEVN